MPSLVDAATALTVRVIGALDGGGEVGLADHVGQCADLTTALGAVRLVGADLFAPHLLDNRPVDPRDADVVADSFEVFPPVGEPTSQEQRVRAWRDWATCRVLARLTGRGEPVPPPDTGLLDEAGSWPRWSVRVAQLSTMALPGVGGPLVASMVRDAPQLAQGATRAVLRRDYPTAARLTRWVARLAGMGVEVPLDPVLLTEHIRLQGGTEPRVMLDLAIAGRLVNGEWT